MKSVIHTVTPLLLLASWAHADEPAVQETADESQETVSAPIDYRHDAFLVVSPAGAAVVRFAKPFERGNETGNGVAGISYEYRFLSREEGAEEQTGVGRVFSKYENGKVKHSLSVVRCGAASVTWEHTDEQSGVVRFNPNQVKLHPVSLTEFGPSELEEIPRAAKKPLELSEFLVAQANIDAAIAGQPIDPLLRRATSHLTYAMHALVVRDANGIATFRFSDGFKRDMGKEVTHQGVGYKFTFQSHDGKIRKAGKSEVYEKYTAKQYDNGELQLTAGDIEFEWSIGGKKEGWIYFEPNKMQIWRVAPEDVQRLVDSL